MTSSREVSELAKANEALREGKYLDAIELYQSAITLLPELETSIRFNMDFAIERLNGLSRTITIDGEHAALIPIDQVDLDAANSNSWLSLGDDPCFDIKLHAQSSLGTGWYYIQLLIDSSNETSLAKFYLDYGTGFSETDSIHLKYSSRTLINRIVQIPSPVKGLRFDPMETKARFKVIAMQWKRVDTPSAVKAMLTHVSQHNPESRFDNTADLRSILEREADNDVISFINLLERKYTSTFADQPGAGNYQEWIETIEKPGLPNPAMVEKMLRKFTVRPLISVVVPTFNTDQSHLCACIDSVIAQSYPYWELCIADDSSSRPHVKETLKRYMAMDSRIKVVFRPINGHISHASNSALELANGDYVALLDHDDMLPEHALLYVVESINANTEADIIYSDEDKIDTRGSRYDPHFKSDWNPELFYSQNYVSHLGVYRRRLLESIGGFRPGVEGSQDYDLLLRCLPHVKDSKIVHIPRVLYHWRSIDGSTASAPGEKSYTTEAGIKALEDYFISVSQDVRVQPGYVPNTYRVHWPIPSPTPLVSLLIPTRDRRALIEPCVRSIIEKSTYENYEIIILDNGSCEKETLDFFEKIQKDDLRVRVLRYDHPFNYSAINNFGAKHARGEVLGLINNDIEVISPDWLTEMVSHVARPEVGCVGAKLYYSNDTIQHAGVILGIGGVAGHSHKNMDRTHSGYFSRLLLPQALSAVTAACLLVRKSIFEEVGGLDEDNLRIAFNDVDFCLKVRSAGYRNVWTPYAELYHHESVSRGAEDSPEKIERFNREVAFMKAKWGDQLSCDPYYSVNLSKKREDFSLAQI